MPGGIEAVLSQQYLKPMLLALIADVQRRKARPGDVAYNTLFVAYHELTSWEPDYPYVQVIVGKALQC